LPRTPDGAIEAVDLAPAERRVRTGPAPGAGTGGARAGARGALLRALRPYTVHQRLVDEELLRVVRTLDERVRGIAAAQATLAAELRRLRDAAGEREGDAVSAPEAERRRVHDGGRVPPSPGT
jgi:hypothetical protein